MKITEPNGLNLALISPDCGTKYSRNLYQWLTSKRNKSRSWWWRVYRDAEGTFWIGMLDGRELIGSRLIAVLCNGESEATAAWQQIHAVEIPDFWARYMTDGRCAIDTGHTMWFIDDETRWSASGDTRACQWCGKASQTLKRWSEVVQCEKWINDKEKTDAEA